jgi:hypothetical protein
MGDRGNICVRDGSEQVWFYTHWTGSGIVDVVRCALARHLRWEDGPYLARIIFDTLTEGTQGEGSGFGISGHMGDNEHEVVTVDVGTQTVRVGDNGAIPFSDFLTARTKEEFKDSQCTPWPSPANRQDRPAIGRRSANSIDSRASVNPDSNNPA